MASKRYVFASSSEKQCLELHGCPQRRLATTCKLYSGERTERGVSNALKRSLEEAQADMEPMLLVLGLGI
jgi:hypothetical protein